jgi:hypothetical protein
MLKSAVMPDDNMSSDVILRDEDSSVQSVGTALQVIQAFDDKGKRYAALVHDVNDKLTINYAGDYSGGVEVQSYLTVNSDLAVAGAAKVGSVKFAYLE